MKSDRDFDVLVVYSGNIAISAANGSTDELMPFAISSGRANYNVAYAYFLETCEEFGLKAAFSTSADIVDAGTCKSYWLYKDKTWKKVEEPCYSRQIFDKFSPRNREMRRQHELLFSSDLIRPFNDPYLHSLFFDKFKTYKRLSNFAIPTVAINDESKTGIAQAVRKLQALASRDLVGKDFTPAIVVKDRFGSGGDNIFKVTKNYTNEITALIQARRDLSFIIQPFMQFENGYSYKNNATATDIRLIYQNGKIIQTYIRMAKANDFRCNEHKGGTLLYVNLKEIPEKVLRLSERIADELQQNNSLFALDFIVSDIGKVYFLEGNIGPGIDWNLAMKKNERLSKELIRGIVGELAFRVDQMRSERVIDHQISKQTPAIPLYPA